MRKHDKYEKILSELRNEIEEGITEILQQRKEILLDNCYLGDYSPLVSGYPEVQKIYLDKYNTVAIQTDVNVMEGEEDKSLDDYTITELNYILGQIEEYDNK